MAQTLWDFAAACYQRPTVAESCLRLQDMVGADVNMLLAAAWLAEQDRAWQSEQVRDLIAISSSWREQCILPLRAVRRYLKGQLEAHTLYEHAKALELEAEIQQLHQLQSTLQFDQGTPGDSTHDLLAANLHTYFDCITSAYRQISAADRTALIAALAKTDAVSQAK